MAKGTTNAQGGGGDENAIVDVALGSDGKSLDFTAAGGQVNNVTIPGSDIVFKKISSNTTDYSDHVKAWDALLSVLSNAKWISIYIYTENGGTYHVLKTISFTGFFDKYSYSTSAGRYYYSYLGSGEASDSNLTLKSYSNVIAKSFSLSGGSSTYPSQIDSSTSIEVYGVYFDSNGAASNSIYIQKPNSDISRFEYCCMYID